MISLTSEWLHWRDYNTFQVIWDSFKQDILDVHHSDASKEIKKENLRHFVDQVNKIQAFERARSVCILPGTYTRIDGSLKQNRSYLSLLLDCY